MNCTQRLITEWELYDCTRHLNNFDNIVQLNLVALPEIESLLSNLICIGDFYTFDGQNLTRISPNY